MVEMPVAVPEGLGWYPSLGGTSTSYWPMRGTLYCVILKWYSLPIRKKARPKSLPA
jgi:hypothetical protein